MSRKTSKKRSLSPFRIRNDSRASAEAYTPKEVNYSNLHDEPNIDIIDQGSLTPYGYGESSRVTKAQFQSVNNKDDQEHQISQQLLDSFIHSEDHKLKESAMQSDI